MINRTNIGIFGNVNAGKSTLMNLLTQQITSIVDPSFGTTTDIKISLMEIHSLGAVKLFDTAGIDEIGKLGDKKRQKTVECLKECDLVLLVIDSRFAIDKNHENIFNLCKIHNKQILILFNEIATDKKDFYNLPFPFISLDFHENQAKNKIIDFIIKNYSSSQKQDLLFPNLKHDDLVFLNIPMDEETPDQRLLRPQAFVQEHLIRRYISTFSYRMNLNDARSKDINIAEKEKIRFKKVLLPLIKENLKLLITDSQAMDIIHPWTLHEEKPLIDITTFSIIMAKEKGDLKEFANGIKTFKSLKKNDKVLIAEACNHNRIKEDIGTYQIPKKIDEYFGKGQIKIDHAFGRDFSSYNLNEYRLIIHCGGCMIDKQKMQSRIKDLLISKVAITNYGMILSFLQSQSAFERVLKPFNLF